ncbi:MAG: hypothetical protein AAFX54_15380 [Pseudomonadota bacterium]
MNKFLKTIATAIVLAPLSSAHAGNTAYGNITDIITNTAGNQFRVALDVAIENPNSCSNTASYAISGATTNYEATIALLMTAYGAGHQVRLVIDDNACEGSFPKITSVWVRPN